MLDSISYLFSQGEYKRPLGDAPGFRLTTDLDRVPDQNDGLGLFKNVNWEAVSNTISDVSNVASQVAPLINPGQASQPSPYQQPQVVYQAAPPPESKQEIPWGWIAAGAGVLFLGIVLMKK